MRTTRALQAGKFYILFEMHSLLICSSIESSLIKAVWLPVSYCLGVVRLVYLVSPGTAFWALAQASIFEYHPGRSGLSILAQQDSVWFWFHSRAVEMSLQRDPGSLEEILGYPEPPILLACPSIWAWEWHSDPAPLCSPSRLELSGKSLFFGFLPRPFISGSKGDEKASDSLSFFWIFFFVSFRGFLGFDLQSCHSSSGTADKDVLPSCAGQRFNVRKVTFGEETRLIFFAIAHRSGAF